MQPNKPQYSIDYLNQIAPQEKRRASNDKLFFGVMGAGLIIALIIGVTLLSNSGGPSLTIQLQNLAAQLTTLQQVANSANTSIQSNQLQGINANLAIQLTNANQAITTPLKNNGVPAAIPQSIISENSDSTLISQLKDAKLNAVYDRVYSTNMTYELSNVLIQMRIIGKESQSKSLSTFINTTEANLQPIYTQLQQFSNQNN